jgi:hypothetical protein
MPRDVQQRVGGGVRALPICPGVAVQGDHLLGNAYAGDEDVENACTQCAQRGSRLPALADNGNNSRDGPKVVWGDADDTTPDALADRRPTFVEEESEQVAHGTGATHPRHFCRRETPHLNNGTVVAGIPDADYRRLRRAGTRDRFADIRVA